MQRQVTLAEALLTSHNFTLCTAITSCGDYQNTFMNNQPNLIDSLIGNSQDYVETRLTLFKLKMVDKSSDIASTVLSFIPLILVFTIVFILLNIGIALLIGDLVGRASWGFLILTGVYIIIALVLYSQRNKWVKVPFANMLIKKFLNNSKV